MVFFLVTAVTPAKILNADHLSSVTALEQCALYTLAIWDEAASILLPRR